MSTPAMVVQIAFGDAPLTTNAAANWIDVSDQVEASAGIEHMIHRGRNHERDENEAGTATIVLRNTDRRFDPNNSSSPYAGHLKPMTKIRIGAQWSSILNWMFHGYVESWHPEYSGGTISTCTLECVDGFKYLGLNDVHTVSNRVQERTGDRISYIFDSWVFWPALERAISLGDIDVVEMPLEGSALALIQQIARAERGSFYISKNGYATFEDRSWRDTATPLALWGGAADGAELPYETVSIRYDDSDIFNRIEVTRMGGIKQTVNDIPSQTTYFIRTLTTSGLPYISDADALTAAETLLHRYRAARTRLDRMVIDPGVRDTWFAVLERELSDMITVRRPTMFDGHTTELDAHIEAIEWRISKGQWFCTWQLSPHYGPPTLGSGTLNTTSDWIDVASGIGFIVANGWGNVGGSFPPAGYRKDADGWVYLRGLVSGGVVGTSGSTMFTLPVGYRPPYNIFQPVTTASGPGTVQVQTDGDTPAILGSNTYFDLSTIRFRVI